MKKQTRASLYRKVKSLSKRLGYHDEDYYKKLYRRSKSQTWLDELDKLKQRLVTRELIKRRKRKIPELFDELKFIHLLPHASVTYFSMHAVEGIVSVNSNKEQI